MSSWLVAFGQANFAGGAPRKLSAITCSRSSALRGFAVSTLSMVASTVSRLA
jgi:hypothetical protein